MTTPDKRFDAYLIWITRCATALAFAWIAAHVVRCDNSDSITDCSRRHKPQIWDGSKWTCDERGQR